MAFSIHDKKVNIEISKLQKWMEEVFGIKNVTKEDTLRYLLKLKQEKKGDNNKIPKWDSL